MVWSSLVILNLTSVTSVSILVTRGEPRESGDAVCSECKLVQLTLAMIHICTGNFLFLLRETIKESEETIPSLQQWKLLRHTYFQLGPHIRHKY